MRWRSSLAVWLVVGLSANCFAQSELATRQDQARQQQAELRRQIETLQKNIENSTRSQQDATQALRQSERAISTVDRELEALQQRQAAVQANMRELATQRKQQEAERERHQQALASQLGAQYKAGSSPWAALLSGDDPNIINRDLYYLSYVSRHQTEQVVALRRTLERLTALRQQAEKNERELQTLEHETQAKRAELAEQKQQHAQVLAKVETELKAQQQQSGRLQQNDKRLGDLIGGLEVEIARQAELARQAAERRKLEAAKKAEQERLAQLERQREQAQLAAAQAQARAEREKQLLERARASQTPVPVAPPRPAPEPADTATPAEPAASPGQVAGMRPPSTYRPPSRHEQLGQHDLHGSGSLTVEETNMAAPAQAQVAQARAVETVPEPTKRTIKLEPDGGFAGLKRGLMRPVAGQIQGRFGKERPDGGVWRGVVLRASAGDPVKAVGAGRVVFADWLSGFGNLLIIDHGKEFLTVYAYNQSLLKQVGDVVDRGELVARVGSTGGQVEPGLYFEIRQQGNVVNPELWLAR